MGNRTSWTYDAVHRVTAETDALNASQLTNTTDRLGRVKNFGYDPRGSQTGEAWVSAGVTVQLQTFAYDGVGNLTRAANGAGAYTLSYDANDRAVSVAGPFGVVLEMGYDAAGNRKSVEDNKNSRMTSTYDALGRLSARAMTGALEMISIEPGRTETVTEIRLTRSYTGSRMVEAKAKVDQVLVSGS